MKRTSTHLATTLQTCDGAVHDACYSALHHRHTAPVSRLNSKHSPQTRLGVDLLASGATGAFLAGAFNPWDRALYLSVRDERPFLARQNFLHPYEGFSQAVAQRVVSGGLYFFLQGVSHDLVGAALQNQGYSREAQAIVVGVTAGFVNGMLLNHLATVKYYTWNTAGGSNLSFAQACREMYATRGYRPFMRGMMATGYRDMFFGLTYEWLRTRYRDRTPFSKLTINLMAGACATVVSGPLNYARNMQYATSLKQPCPSTWRVIADLFTNARNQPSWRAKLHYLQFRLRVGWGSLRVAVGMSAGQALFDWTRGFFGADRIEGDAA
eukprot:m.27980 g.27980  ORF g.27980 m.27980 type:complete len:324 (-) comp11797_c0_seq1:50-1021(-)